MAAHAFYRFFTGDYLRDAGHLSLLEHGCYRRLIDLYMIEGGPLPFDMPRLYRLLHATSKEEQQAVQVVVEEFFRMDGSMLRHGRCDRELEWQKSVYEKAVLANKARWEKVKNQKLASIRNANGSIRESEPEPEPEPDIKKREKHLPGLPAGFGVFWATYPHFPQRSSRAEALRRWNAMKLEPISKDVMRALNACLDIPQWTRDGRAFVSAAEVWLRKRLWEQDLMAPVDSLVASLANDPRFKDFA
jgi:uncharacterized protein YdaU (DUF1376 family)